jgi:hypothetical protein
MRQGNLISLILGLRGNYHKWLSWAFQFISNNLKLVCLFLFILRGTLVLRFRVENGKQTCSESSDIEPSMLLFL